MYGGALEALMCLSNYADAKTLDAQVYIGKYSEQKKDNQRHFKGQV